MIIAVLNQKGGSGKTTLAVNLARFLTIRHIDQKTILIDSDPQGSARNWHVNNGASLLDVIGLDRPTIDKDINKFKLNYDHIIIDGAPQLNDMAAKTVICSDIVLIPVQPSPYDIWASSDIVELIKQRQTVTEGWPKTAFVVSRQIVNTNMGRDIRGILEQYELPIFEAGTFQRICYAETANVGGTVFDSNHNTTEARKEIEKIVLELRSFMNEKTQHKNITVNF